jgi:hypothetical protein
VPEQGEPRLVYDRIELAGRLCGGEILSGFVEHQAVFGEGDYSERSEEHPYIVVLSQDCDLEQDDRARNTPDMEQSKRTAALLRHVLLVTASAAEAVRVGVGGKDIWKRVKQNKDERYQYLTAVAPAEGMLGSGVPDLVLDFKRTLSCPIGELLGAIGRGETIRRAKLRTPYVEHLAHRFGFFFQRIPLPRDHHDLSERPSEDPAEPAKIVR